MTIVYRVVDSIGQPYLAMITWEGRMERNLATMQLPTEIMPELINVCARQLFHNGDSEQRAAFIALVKEWTEVVS